MMAAARLKEWSWNGVRQIFVAAVGFALFLTFALAWSGRASGAGIGRKPFTVMLGDFLAKGELAHLRRGLFQHLCAWTSLTGTFGASGSAAGSGLDLAGLGRCQHPGLQSRALGCSVGSGQH